MEKSQMTERIAKKRNGNGLSGDEISELIRAYTVGETPDSQMASWLMAVFFQGMDSRETLALTRSMVDSGLRLDLSGLGIPRADKHSTGGVGDKTSLVLAPLVAAAGVAVPMISGRTLGFTGGTLNKLESIPGFRVDLTIPEFVKVLEKVGCAMIGQTAELAPADRKIYALRDLTATVECIPLIVASILSKKLVEDLDALVLDVKFGNGAFMPTVEKASELAENLVEVANSVGTKTCALLTDMNQPLGFAIGNALEVAESIDTLKGNGPADFRDLCVELAASMVALADPERSMETARDQVAALLRSGKALEVFGRMVEAQGGDPRIVDREDRLPRSSGQFIVRAARSGCLARAEARQLAIASMKAGAALNDPAAGIVVHKKVADWVDLQAPLCTIHYNREDLLAETLVLAESAFQISETEVSPPTLVERIISGKPESKAKEQHDGRH
jgi:pyrimidine-nucleoside phosphorylase